MGALRPRWEGSKAKIGGAKAMIGGSKANLWRLLGHDFRLGGSGNSNPVSEA